MCILHRRLSFKHQNNYVNKSTQRNDIVNFELRARCKSIENLTWHS